VVVSCRALIDSRVPAVAFLQAPWAEQQQRFCGRESVDGLWSGVAAYEIKKNLESDG